jgi:eukaryotic-like serine/threonine-protein kinase
MVEFGHSKLEGQVLDGRYRVLEKIGVGGMGDVYKAEQLAISRKVAIKVLRPSSLAGEDRLFRQRFLREASSTARLSHPNTVKIFDSGETSDGQLFLVMEYLEGNTLSVINKAEGALPWVRAVDIAVQICRSVREAHSMGLIHRDLKPANVMLLNHMHEQHFVKVLDFGLVKSVETDDADATQANMLMGSPTYMAPEQARGEASVHSDIYAIGVMLFQMLSGKPPFEAKSSVDVLLAHIQSPIPSLLERGAPGNIPPVLETVVRRCLDKNPLRRFESADALIIGLKAASGQPMLTETSYPALRLSNHATPMPFSRESVAPADRAVDVSVDAPLMASLAAAVPHSEKSGKRVGLAVVGAGVAVIAASVGLMAVMARSNAAPATAIVKPIDGPPPPAPPVAAIGNVTFHIDSIPTGATVLRDGKPLGSTPFTLSLPASSPSQPTSIQLTLSKVGFVSTSVHASGFGPKVELIETLQPQGKAVAETPARGGKTTVKDRLASRKGKSVELDAPRSPSTVASSTPVVPSPAPESSNTLVAPPSTPAAPAPAVVRNEPPAAPAAAVTEAPKSRNVPAFVMEKDLVSRGAIRLPESFKTTHRGESLSGLYRICVGTNGRVKTVDTVKSVPGADTAVAEGVKEGWLYKTQSVDSCFLYTMPIRVN